MKNWIPFIDFILRLLFGTKQERDLKRLEPLVDFIGLFERAVHDRDDEWLRERTEVFRAFLEDPPSAADRGDFYRELLREAHERLGTLDPEKRAEALGERLRENRGELSTKYEGDAFQVAIESPLREDNVEGLTEDYRERLSAWREEPLEDLMERFEQGWSQFMEEAPEDPEERNLWLLMPLAFSVVREAAHRRLGLRHYDVQVLGGIVLHEGRIAEMKTGEGKTLAATMPLYLRGLTGRGSHLVTVNDYLARRDARWMGEVYEKLGMEVGLIQEGMPPEDRRPAYEAPITYGTNNEFGFDYLRDNMATRPEDTVQPERYFAIIDEVDSVLIDEARTPLIISGQADKPISLYRKVDRVVARLDPETDYEVDPKKKTVSLTDEGVDNVEQRLGVENLFDTSNMELVHHINQAIRAHELYERDSEYVVQDDQVIIVDEFTGRLQPGRRFGEGLHQAIEAKEDVTIEQETQTLATITIQNFFRMYDVLSGMTGTADTEAEEFAEIYDLDVVVVPTHEPDIRVDYEDAIYRTEDEKFDAVVDEIEHLHEHGQPVLVGTVDIENSERLGRLLERRGIDHNTLNAKHHEREAAIVAHAGEAGAVTIATNMAGRGTDIVLGEGVIEEGCPVEADDPDEDPYCPHDPLCGLHVLGTERHEARRIDNQLRGRTARQGDPGASRFFVSLEDDLMQLFGSDRISGMLESLGLEEGQRIEHSWISKSIARAQSKVETRNFEIRKRLLEYDDVMDRQREIIYEERRKALEEDDVSDTILNFLEAQVEEWVEEYGQAGLPAEDWPLTDLLDAVEALVGWRPEESLVREWRELRAEALQEALHEALLEQYRRKEEQLGKWIMRDVESQLLLQTIDSHWKEHLYNLDSLKQGIQLEGMAQRDPLVEYKRESFGMFEELQRRIREELLGFLFQVETVTESAAPTTMGLEDAEYQHDEAMDMADLVGSEETARSPEKAQAVGAQSEGGPDPVVKGEDVGRNDPCPCGSGKKYKYCCGG